MWEKIKKNHYLVLIAVIFIVIFILTVGKAILLALLFLWQLNPKGYWAVQQAASNAETSLFWKIVDVIRQNNIPVEKSSVLSVEAMGQLGDSFGAINWIVSAVALFFVALTYKTQKEELNEARARGEVDRFDRIYISHRELTAAIEHKKDEIFTGAAAFNHEYERFLRYAMYIHNNADVSNIPKVHGEREDQEISKAKELRDQQAFQPKQQAIDGFNKYHNEAQFRIEPYFHSLSYVLQMAERIKNEADKNASINLVYSQLSPQEFVLIFYYAVTLRPNDNHLRTIARNQDLRARFSHLLLHPNHTNLL